MSVLPDPLRALLERFDGSSDPFHDSDVERDLNQFAKGNPERPADLDSALKSEFFAWSLHANSSGEDSPWGTHFGPSMQFGSHEIPSRSALTAGMIEFWMQRIQEVKHPRLRSRYSDAAWDLASITEGSKPQVAAVHAAIDSYIEDADLPGELILQVEGLERALYLALKLRDDSRIDKARDAIIAFQKKIADPSKPRFISFHFEALFEVRKKVRLTDEQLREIIDGMERQLAEWSDPASGAKFDPLSSRDLAKHLIQYYRAQNSVADVQRITKTYAKGLLHVCAQAEGMFARNWLEHLHADYLDAGLRAEADALMSKIREAGEKAESQMAKVSTRIKVSKEEMDGFCEAITEGGAEVAIQRIALEFTPDPEKLREEMHKMAQKHPLMGRIPMVIADEFTRARIGGMGDDESGRLVMHIHQHMAFKDMWLYFAIDRLISRYQLTAGSFVELLYQSELFAQDRKALLVTAMRQFLLQDNISAIHVLIPQIESLLRRLYGIGGVSTKLDSKTGTYQEKDLGSILNDPLMIEFWKNNVGRDLALYFRIVLTDHRSLNARNRVCHGLCDEKWFGRQICDRLLHVLMILSMIRGKRPEPPEDAGPKENE